MTDLPLDAAQALHLSSPAALAWHLSGGKWQRGIAHLEHIDARILANIVKPSGRLMVHAPPRHGKSHLGTFWTAVWALALRPDWNIAIVTHSHDFSATWGRMIRNVVDQHWPELGVTVSHDSRAAYRWNTRQGGGCLCIGLGGTLIGRGANVLIIDDPVKDGGDSLSETIQRDVWETYRSSALTRLEPDATVLIYQQRWHPEDLSGKLLAAQAAGPETEGYDEWEVICLPARAKADDLLGREPGEALWPSRYPSEALARIERGLGRYWWQAQYQQEPSSPGGDLIKEAWWSYWVPAGMLNSFPPVSLNGSQRPVVELPDNLRETFQSWDMNFRDSARAIEKGKEPDPVAGHVWGFKGADMFLLDRFHAPVGLEETIHAVREMSEKWPEATTKLIEYAANGPAVIARLRAEVGGFRPVTPRGSKTARVLNARAGPTPLDRDGRAVSMAASVQGGNMYIPHPGYRPWSVDFRHLLGLFPQGGRDDADAASQAWGHAMSPIWQSVEAAHREALDLGGPPAVDTRELFRRQLWARVQEEQDRQLPPSNPYRR